MGCVWSVAISSNLAPSPISSRATSVCSDCDVDCYRDERGQQEQVRSCIAIDLEEREKVEEERQVVIEDLEARKKLWIRVQHMNRVGLEVSMHTFGLFDWMRSQGMCAPTAF